MMYFKIQMVIQNKIINKINKTKLNNNKLQISKIMIKIFLKKKK